MLSQMFLPPKSRLPVVMLDNLLRSKLPLLVLTQPPSPKLRLRLRPKLELVLELVLPLLLLPTLPPVQTHNTLLSKNLKEESLLMFWNKEPALNARPDKLLKSTILVPSLPTVKCSILQSQEASQSPSLSET